MRMWEITTEFPHRTVLTLGLIILGGGVLLLILGTVDVTRTAILYTSQYNNCPSNWPSELQNPCNHDNLVWTWVSAAIWGGFLIILVGVLAIILNGTKTVDRLKFARDMFLVGCILLAFPICPVIIVCIGLEIGYDKGVFYYNMDSGSISIEDDAKFVIPVLNLIITVMVWMTACVAIMIICLRKLNITKKLVLDKPSTPQTVVIPQIKQPVNQIVAVAPPAPVVVQQPQPQYEVSIIQSPAPKPYYVTAPHPDSAMVHVMNRLNQRGPSIGPMYGPYSPEMLGLEPVPGPPPPPFIGGPPMPFGGGPPFRGGPLPPDMVGPPMPYGGGPPFLGGPLPPDMVGPPMVRPGPPVFEPPRRGPYM